MSYANKKNIDFVALIGEDELKTNKITLKNMINGSQEIISVEEMIKNKKMNKFFELGKNLNLDEISKLLFENKKIRLSKKTENKISKSRYFLEKKLQLHLKKYMGLTLDLVHYVILK